MNDLASLADSAQAIAVCALVLIGLFALLYRRALVGTMDPLFINGALVCVYLAGLLVFLEQTRAPSSSSLWITAGITLALFGPALVARKPAPAFCYAEPSRRIVTLFQLCIAFLLVLNLIANYIFGVIPLLEGTETRSEQGGVLIPTLVLIAPQIGIVAVCILAIQRKSNWLTRFNIAAWMITIVLSGSKSALIQLLVVYVFYVYLKRYGNTQQAGVSRRSRKLLTKFSLIAIIVMVPIYFAFVVGSDGTMTLPMLFLFRLVTGFDIVAYMAINNIDAAAVTGASVSGFYFYPFLKALGMTPEYQSAGQYVSAEVFGYANSLSTLNPNSNLIVEWIMSSGNLLGVAISVFLVMLAFHLRTNMFERREIRLFDMFLMPQFVLAPFGMLLDGSLFFITLIWTMLVYILVNTMANIAMRTKKSSLLYKLY